MPQSRWIQQSLGKTKAERRARRGRLHRQLKYLGFDVDEREPIPRDLLESLHNKDVADKLDPTGRLWRRVHQALNLIRVSARFRRRQKRR